MDDHYWTALGGGGWAGVGRDTRGTESEMKQQEIEEMTVILHPAPFLLPIIAPLPNPQSEFETLDDPWLPLRVHLHLRSHLRYGEPAETNQPAGQTRPAPRCYLSLRKQSNLHTPKTPGCEPVQFGALRRRL